MLTIISRISLKCTSTSITTKKGTFKYPNFRLSSTPQKNPDIQPFAVPKKKKKLTLYFNITVL